MSIAVWEELVATALLGTERRPPAPPSQAAGALAQALEALTWEDSEGALLGAASLLAGYRAAGWQPPVLDEPGSPSPAPADPRPLCSPGADALLALLLAGGPAVLVPEWLRLADAAGVRPPPEQLPALLDAAVTGSMRAAVLQAGGDRLRWLAAQHERWSWAAGDAAAGAGTATRWEHGTRDERLALLRRMRDGDRAQGRELLASTWAADDAATRAMLIQALAIGLEPADEPFLESTLDDRSKLVRQHAAQLLAGLPGSALGARMTERLRPLVSVGGRLRRTLQVQTPEEPDDAARRDGIDDAGRPHDLGAGAWRLAQLVGATPLTAWREMTGADAAATFALARGADHEPALKIGWRDAARRQRDPQWSAVLARETGELQLLDALAPGAADEVALPLLARASNVVELTDVLERIAAPWSSALSRAAIDHLARVAAGDAPGWGIRLSHIALALDLSIADAATAAIQELMQRELQPALRRQLEDLLAMLDLRHAMTRELTPR